MTFKEKLKTEHPDCVNEKYDGGCKGCPDDYGYETEEESAKNCKTGGGNGCEYCWNCEIPNTEKIIIKREGMPDEVKYISVDEHDTVNHPSHYCREGGMESIDEMVTVFGVEAVMNFCLCNVWKYRYRAADKNGEEDLHKSDWYMKKYAELKGSAEDDKS